MKRRVKRRPSIALVWGSSLLVLCLGLVDSFAAPHLYAWLWPPMLPGLLWFCLDALPIALALIGATAWLNRALYRLRDRAVFARMGYWTADRRALLAGCGAFAAAAAMEWLLVRLAGAHVSGRSRPLVRIMFTLLLPGLMEETLFRGFILRNLRDVLARWPAIGISATLFALYHLPYLIATWAKSPAHLPFMSGLLSLLGYGVVLGWIYLRTGFSLPTCVLAHVGGDLPTFYTASLPASASPNWWFFNGYLVTSPLRPILAGMVVWSILGRGPSWREASR